ncbi:MAG: hypothetical protein CMJ78_22745 [Planctomycetaceae bacterium]|nr:hypothetical protein [Planctomycetaceae bacterium]
MDVEINTLAANGRSVTLDGGGADDSALGTIQNDESPTSVTLVGNDIVIDDVGFGGASNVVLLATDRETLTISELTGLAIDAFGFESGDVTGDGTSAVQIQLSAFGGDILVNLRGGNDLLVVDHGDGNFTNSIAYDGGPPTEGDGDALALQDGSFSLVEHILISESSGTVNVFGNAQLTYQGLEPIFDSLVADVRSFVFTGPASFYSGDGTTELIIIPQASQGTYNLSLAGVGNGDFSVSAAMVNADGTVQMENVAGNIAGGELELALDFTGGPTIPTDGDSNDGIPSDTIVVQPPTDDDDDDALAVAPDSEEALARLLAQAAD